MRDQFKTVHFWMMLLGAGLIGCLERGIIPQGTPHELALVFIGVLQVAGVQMAARWLPPDSEPGKLLQPEVVKK